MLSKTIQKFNVGLWTYGLKPLSVAGFFVLVALLWTFPLQHVMAYPFVFLFVAAVIGSSWLGGAIAGCIAMVLSLAVIDFFFIPPLYSLSVSQESRTYVAAYLACALVSIVVITLRKRSEAAVRFAKEELEVRVQERTAELEQSNREILERERQVRAIAEAIPQQIWAADPEGRIEYCNPQLLAFVGRGNSELRDEDFFRIFHPQDVVEFRERWEAGRANVADFELRARIRGPESTFRWFLVRGIPQRRADGSVSRWYGIHTDIEEQQREQERLRRAQEDLSRTTRMTSMAEMAASIAHELNQPLAALMTDASACRKWLRSTPLNVERASAAADRIVRDTARASAVISRVRSLFSKTDYIRNRTNLNLLIEELAELLKEEAATRKISLDLELESDLPMLCVDPVQIQQVLVNLARNGMDAMQHAREPRVLRISSRREGVSEVVVSMTDSGLGLSDDVRDRAFDPFFTTKVEGGGMGLAICRSIVEAHDGRIWASSSPDGATFQFALKYQPAREGEPD